MARTRRRTSSRSIPFGSILLLMLEDRCSPEARLLGEDILDWRVML